VWDEEGEECESWGRRKVGGEKVVEEGG